MIEIDSEVINHNGDLAKYKLINAKRNKKFRYKRNTKLL